jgi:hypothetical protein
MSQQVDDGAKRALGDIFVNTELAISSARRERSKNGLRMLAAEAYYLAGQIDRSLRLLLKVKPDLLRSSSRDLFERFKANLFRIIRSRGSRRARRAPGRAD